MAKRASSILLLSMLVSSCGTTGTISTTIPAPNNSGAGNGTGFAASFQNIKISDTAASITESADGKIVSKDVIYRANSAYNSNGTRFDRVEGHQVTARYGKTETGSSGNVSSYKKDAQFYDGVLTSTSSKKEVSIDAVDFNSAQLLALKNLRTTVDSLKLQFDSIKNDATKTAEAQSINSQLASAYDDLAALIDAGDVQIGTRNVTGTSGSSDFKGNFGWFSVKNGSSYSQLSAIYAKADGVNAANYDNQAKVVATYATNFKGAAIQNGKLIGLTGQGDVVVDFTTNKLSADINVASNDNSEAGKITFDGEAKANSNGTMFMNASSPKFNVSKGNLKASTNGYAEATLVDDGKSILGSVVFNDQTQAIVGGFGGNKK